jgi:4-amino-4-deoxy-L-arabinose transferase-like glycosyltransferase
MAGRLAPLERSLAQARTERAVLWALFAGATALRLWFVLFQHRPGDHVFSDMAGYDFRAQRLLSGSRDMWDTFTPSGYPALLALLYSITDSSRTFVGVVQAFLGGATCVLTHRIALSASGNQLVALLSALGVAVHFPLIFYSGLLLTEAPFAFLLVLSLWLLLRAVKKPSSGTRALLAGLSLGAATVTRPNLLALYPLLLLYLWLALADPQKPPAARARALLLLASKLLAAGALPLLLACSYNSRIAGQPAGLATNGGLNFFLNFSEAKLVKYHENGQMHQIAPIPNLIRFQHEQEVSEPFCALAHDLADLPARARAP